MMIQFIMRTNHLRNQSTFFNKKMKYKMSLFLSRKNFSFPLMNPCGFPTWRRQSSQPFEFLSSSAHQVLRWLILSWPNGAQWSISWTLSKGGKKPSTENAKSGQFNDLIFFFVLCEVIWLFGILDLYIEKISNGLLAPAGTLELVLYLF